VQEDDIVHLASAVNPVEAHVWKQALEEEGIPCRVVGDYLDVGIGDVPGMRAEVWVHRDDVERARTALAEHRKEAAAALEAEEESSTAIRPGSPESGGESSTAIRPGGPE
jgi:hypothetical protein